MRYAILAIALAVGACDLTEITIAESEDVVVAEITLRAGDAEQRAFLHRSLRTGLPVTVPNATIEVRNTRGDVLRFAAAPLHDCVADTIKSVVGTCYRSTNPNYAIEPGQTYTLRIDVPGAETLTSSTRVPQPFGLVTPAVRACSLAPGTAFTIEWTRSDDAWVYVSETLLTGLAAALQQQGIELEDDPLRLFALSLSNEDSTVVFPTEFGLFQRFDEDLTAALIAIQGGLPPGVTAAVTIAAADRNYVNWERGGNFNPSGLVRVASIRGGGTGVFGSMVPLTFTVTVGGSQPACRG